MKLRNPRMIRVVATLAAGLIRVWTGTVRNRLVNHDRDAHPADVRHARYIYTFWHESLLAPARFRVPVRLLISKHADGELIAQAASRLGFGVVRGSTNRGGGGALMELLDASDAAHLMFTPDGPRGPRRRVQAGVIALASKSGLPIVPVGVGYTHAWRARSWDRFAVPRPFSENILVVGEAMPVAADLDREGTEAARLELERRMTALTDEAERRADPRRKAAPLPSPHFSSNLSTSSTDKTRTD
jgi:lysophospholipid acyltransferase (LPLAT)-like uncharacterized protein